MSAAPAPRLRVLPPVARPARTRRIDLAWDTPIQLWTLLGLAAASALLVLLSVSAAMTDSRQALKTVGSDSVPSINYALDLSSAMSDMDAGAANYR